MPGAVDEEAEDDDAAVAAAAVVAVVTLKPLYASAPSTLSFPSYI
jgi:hypothetical protein